MHEYALRMSAMRSATWEEIQESKIQFTRFMQRASYGPLMGLVSIAGFWLFVSGCASLVLGAGTGEARERTPRMATRLRRVGVVMVVAGLLIYAVGRVAGMPSADTTAQVPDAPLHMKLSAPVFGLIVFPRTEYEVFLGLAQSVGHETQHHLLVIGSIFKWVAWLGCLALIMGRRGRPQGSAEVAVWIGLSRWSAVLCAVAVVAAFGFGAISGTARAKQHEQRTAFAAGEVDYSRIQSDKQEMNRLAHQERFRHFESAGLWIFIAIASFHAWARSRAGTAETLRGARVYPVIVVMCGAIWLVTQAHVSTRSGALESLLTGALEDRIREESPPSIADIVRNTQYDEPVRPQKEPRFIDVHPNHLILHPGEQMVTWESRDQLESRLADFIAPIEERRDSEYVVLLVRPQSASIASHLRDILRNRNIDVDLEMFDAGRPVNYESRRIIRTPNAGNSP